MDVQILFSIQYWHLLVKCTRQEIVFISDEYKDSMNVFNCHFNQHSFTIFRTT